MRTRITMTAATLLTAVLIATALPANAAEPAEDTDASTGSVSQYLAEHPYIVIADETVLDSSGALVVDANGQTVQELGDATPSEARSSDAASPESAQAAAAGCSYTNAVFTNQAGWQESVNGCSIIGFDWSARWGYTWNQDIFAWNSGPSCVQGRGYSTTHSVSTPVWFNAGCGGSGSVSAYIGNHATVAKIRGHVNAIAKIGYVRWK